jgi:hypothetical protein
MDELNQAEPSDRRLSRAERERLLLESRRSYFLSSFIWLVTVPANITLVWFSFLWWESHRERVFLLWAITVAAIVAGLFTIGRRAKSKEERAQVYTSLCKSVLITQMPLGSLSLVGIVAFILAPGFVAFLSLSLIFVGLSVFLYLALGVVLVFGVALMMGLTATLITRILSPSEPFDPNTETGLSDE